MCAQLVPYVSYHSSRKSWCCVCVENPASHLPQQIFPGGWRSQCVVFMNMICACKAQRCTWLICRTEFA